MSNETIVALVAAGGALIVAMISLVNSIITNRQTRQTSKIIEEYKFTLDQKKADRTLFDSEFKKNLEALEFAIQGIQILKDDIKIILAAVEDNLDTDLAIKRIKASSTSLMSIYDRYTAHLAENENSTLHSAKNKAILVQNSILTALKNKKFASDMSTDERSKLEASRRDLTDLQNVMRDHRSHRIVERFSGE